MKCFGTSVLLPSIIVFTAGFFTQSEPPASGGPRVLSDSEAQPYYEVFNKYPEKVRKSFGWRVDKEALSNYLKCEKMNEHPYPQTILMPSNETLMIISGLGNVGLIIFDTKTKQIKEVISWSAYLGTEIEEDIYAFEVVHYRFRQYEDKWKLIAEVHAITKVWSERSTHYFWEFSYAPNARGSSFRYCAKETGWSPLPERINRRSQR